MHDVYLYYRVDPAYAAVATRRIDELMTALASYCAQVPRRRVRCDDPMTWMEIYEGIADYPAFLAALDAGTRTAGCADFTAGERHLECFAEPGFG